MNSALLLLLLAAVACSTAAQDAQNATDTSQVLNSGSKDDTTKTESNVPDEQNPDTGAEEKSENQGEKDEASVLDGSANNANKFDEIDDESNQNTTTADIGAEPATDETNSTLNTTTAANETVHTSVEEPHVTVEKDGVKQTSTLEVDGHQYKIVVDPINTVSGTDDSNKTQEETYPDSVTEKTPEDSSEASTVSGTGSTTQKTPEDSNEASTVSGTESTKQKITPLTEATTQESGDKSSTESTKASSVEVTTQESGEQSSTKSTEASSVEATTQKATTHTEEESSTKSTTTLSDEVKTGTEEESSTKSTEAPLVEVTAQKTGEESSTKSTKAPTDDGAVNRDELPKTNSRRKRETGSNNLNSLITVERDGAKETFTLALEGVRYQIIIEKIEKKQTIVPTDPNLDDTQGDGSDDDIVSENGDEKKEDTTGTGSTSESFPTPKQLPLEGGSDSEVSTEAPVTGKGSDNVTKSTVAA